MIDSKYKSKEMRNEEGGTEKQEVKGKKKVDGRRNLKRWEEQEREIDRWKDCQLAIAHRPGCCFFYSANA